MPTHTRMIALSVFLAAILGVLLLVSKDRSPAGQPPILTAPTSAGISDTEPLLRPVEQPKLASVEADRPERIVGGRPNVVWHVVAVDDITAKPVAGAEIRVLGVRALKEITFDTDAQERGFRDLGALEDGLKSVAVIGKTNDQGVLGLTADDCALIIARSGDSWGMVERQATDAGAETVVRLFRDGILRVKVKDEQGRPIGKVKIRLRTALPKSISRSKLDEITAWTNPESGIAVVEHAGWLIGQSDEPLTLSVVALLDKPVTRSISLADLDGPPVELVLPTCGAVTLRLHETSGELHQGLTLFVLDGMRDDGTAPSKRTISATRSLRVTSRNGEAIFSTVQTSLTLTCQAVTDAPEKRVSKNQNGPTRAGEQVTVSLGLAEPLTVVGNAVTNEGEPLREWALRASALPVGIGEARTAKDGSFEFKLSDWRQDLNLRLAAQPSGGAQANPRVASINTTVPTGSTRVILGTVVFGEQWLLAGGQVVGDDGMGVTGSAVLAMPLVQDHRADSAQPVALSATTDLNGNFEIWGNAFKGDVQVNLAPQVGLFSRRVVVQSGTSDVTLVAQKSGTLEGRVLLDHRTPPQSILVTAVEGHGLERRTIQIVGLVPTSDGGTFQLSNIPAGLIGIQVSAAGIGPALVTIEDIKVSHSGMPTDSRVNPIDLRLLAHTIEVALSTEDGVPIDQASVWWRSGASRKGWNLATFVGSKATLTVGPEEVELVVYARGFQLATRDNVLSDQLIQLRRGFDVAIELDRNQVPEGSLCVCRLFLLDRSTLWNVPLDEPASALCDSSLVAHVVVSVAGEYALSVAPAGSRGPTRPGDDWPRVIVDPASGSPIRYRVQDPRAYERLRGQR